MIDFIDIPNKRITDNVFLKLEYLNHPDISGNKYRKLKYNLIEAKIKGFETIITFGGAFSNHIAAVASAGQEFGFKTIGVIRGEELENNFKGNQTLEFARDKGMDLKFISRKDYRHKLSDVLRIELSDQFGAFYYIPEGGTNALAVKGCEEILNELDSTFDYLCCPVGTGGTISGLINASHSHQKVLGFPVLKGDFLNKDIATFAKQSNWELITPYHFGGYAKINEDLISFINQFKATYGVPLDPIYTGKMMFGIFDLLKKGYFKNDAKILAIHTGGLQGIKGMNMTLKKKNLPLISL